MAGCLFFYLTIGESNSGTLAHLFEEFLCMSEVKGSPGTLWTRDVFVFVLEVTSNNDPLGRAGHFPN